VRHLCLAVIRTFDWDGLRAYQERRPHLHPRFLIQAWKSNLAAVDSGAGINAVSGRYVLLRE